MRETTRHREGGEEKEKGMRMMETVEKKGGGEDREKDIVR